ncbi:hypothetical protein SBRCBS47491_005645 [Sporothrix bragantina]|uniref:Uncharacterized protein n=1 Tax=Sporothrix bragantina TaxID=671064 RepID=A0ABP0BYG7_9PEZI
MGQPTSPLEPFPAATTSPGIEMSQMNNVPAESPESTTPFPTIDNNTLNNINNSDDNIDAADPSPLANTRLFRDRDDSNTVGRERRESVAASSTVSDSLPRRLSKRFEESTLQPGFLAATADLTSTVVTAARSRSGTRTRSSTVSDPEERQRALQQLHQQQRVLPKNGDSNGMLATLDEHLRAASMDISRKEENDAMEKEGKDGSGAHAIIHPTTSAVGASSVAAANINNMNNNNSNIAASDADVDAPLYSEYDNGYHFPPKYSTGESFRHASVAFWHYFTTPVGFFVVLYGCNIVAWGGMLFLLLCNASPAMCHPTCNDIDSPRRIWIEIDSQILNGLFCVTGFGLAPWRFRDMYYYLQWRIGKKEKGLRRLAGVHRGWLRLPGSQELPITTGPDNVPPETPCSAIPFPESKIPDMPLTGQRAPPTRHWAIVFVLCMNLGNTFLQCVLCGFMWGMNRYDRPSWSTGLFVALGCLAGAFGGLGMFVEGKRVKGIEGVPLSDEDRLKLAEDRERGIYHYNNLKAKKPKEKVTDVEAGQK